MITPYATKASCTLQSYSLSYIKALAVQNKLGFLQGYISGFRKSMICCELYHGIEVLTDLMDCAGTSTLQHPVLICSL